MEGTPKLRRRVEEEDPAEDGKGWRGRRGRPERRDEAQGRLAGRPRGRAKRVALSMDPGI